MFTKKTTVFAVVLSFFPFASLAVDSDVPMMMLSASQKLVDKKYNEAIAAYTQVISKDSTNVDAYLQRAFTYREMGQVGPMQADAIVAIKLVETKISKGTESARLYYQRGSGYRLLKKFPEAKADIQKAISIKNNPAWRLDLQAILLEEKMK